MYKINRCQTLAMKAQGSAGLGRARQGSAGLSKSRFGFGEMSALTQPLMVYGGLTLSHMFQLAASSPLGNVELGPASQGVSNTPAWQAECGSSSVLDRCSGIGCVS